MATVDVRSSTREFLQTCVNRDEVDRLADFVAADVLVHAGTTCDIPEVRGLPELADVLRRIHRVFPDLHLTLEDMVAEGDRVAVRWTARGTHEREWAGVPATGRRVTFGGMDLYRYEGGRIREWWRNEDFAHLMDQLSAPDA